MQHNATRKQQHGGIGLWLVLLLLLIGAVIGGAIVALWVFSNVNASLVIANERAKVIADEPFHASARVTDDLRIRIDERITTSVPVDEHLSLPVRDPLEIQAEFDAEVPIQLDVRVQDTIQINQVLDVDAVIEAKVLGDWHELPIRGKIPVNASVPVDLLIPVDEMVRLNFTAPVRAVLKDNLQVPLKTTINTTIPIQSEMSVPLLSDLEAEVTLPKDQALDVLINYADLTLPLNTLRLGLRDKRGGEPEPPQRAETANAATGSQQPRPPMAASGGGASQ